MSGVAATAAIVAGYVLGAIPFGVLAGRLAGVDPRSAGSGRTGATNVLRTVGRPAAIAVFLLDLAKGLAAVLLSRSLYAGPGAEWVAAAAGLAAVVGHIRSVFIGFRGGRGVATSAGALLALAPVVVAVISPIVLTAIWVSRYVSLGSVLGAASAPLAAALLTVAGLTSIEATVYALAAGVLVVAAHADNIGRLRAGTERKLGNSERVEAR
jgi:acyl phosphate:glycerol-3-phosphate acyltransferase